jgi:hypothetical protein
MSLWECDLSSSLCNCWQQHLYYYGKFVRVKTRHQFIAFGTPQAGKLSFYIIYIHLKILFYFPHIIFQTFTQTTIISPSISHNKGKSKLIITCLSRRLFLDPENYYTRQIFLAFPSSWPISPEINSLTIHSQSNYMILQKTNFTIMTSVTIKIAFY